MALTTSNFDQELLVDTHNLYDVTFFEDTISTLVTTTPSFVDSWISDIERIHRRRLHSLIVGLDVEWLPNFAPNITNPVAVLQLCVGRRCLVFQIRHSPSIPLSLKNFLNNPAYTFAGVEIDNDVEKLTKDYDLVVAKTADVRELAVEVYGVRELKKAGLKNLTLRVLGKQISKPKDVSISSWDNRWLTPAQIQYACIDAFLSFEIGRILISDETSIMPSSSSNIPIHKRENIVEDSEVVCECGIKCKMWISWTENNPGRRFIECPNYFDKNRNCKYFFWIDPMLRNDWYKKTLRGYHLKIKNYSKEENWESNHKDMKICELENEVQRMKSNIIKSDQVKKKLEIELEKANKKDMKINELENEVQRMKSNIIKSDQVKKKLEIELEKTNENDMKICELENEVQRMKINIIKSDRAKKKLEIELEKANKNVKNHLRVIIVILVVVVFVVFMILS